MVQERFARKGELGTSEETVVDCRTKRMGLANLVLQFSSSEICGVQRAAHRCRVGGSEIFSIQQSHLFEQFWGHFAKGMCKVIIMHFLKLLYMKVPMSSKKLVAFKRNLLEEDIQKSGTIVDLGYSSPMKYCFLLPI